MLILDLKTVPDPAVGKRLLALEKFSDAEAELAMKTLRIAGHQSAIVPPQQRRIAAAALVVAMSGQFAVETFSAATDEAETLAAIEHSVSEKAGSVWAWDPARGYRGQLLVRALATGVAMPTLLATNGPQSLASYFGFQPGVAPLAELAAVYGLPHRLGLRAADAEVAHARGDAAALIAGSAADALIAYLLCVALKAATGEVNATEHAARRLQVSHWLATQTAAHWRQFHAAWKA